jgi:hypothetical protein
VAPAIPVEESRGHSPAHGSAAAAVRGHAWLQRADQADDRPVVNELTDSGHRDPLTATPFHSHVRPRPASPGDLTNAPPAASRA